MEGTTIGRRFSLTGENLTLSTGSVLASIATAAAGNAGCWIEIERVEVSQSHNATTAQCRIAQCSRNSSGTLTVTSATPAPLVIGGSASGIAGGTNGLTAATCGVNSSADSGGSYTTIHCAAMNNQGGFLWTYLNEAGKIIVPPSSIYVLRFLAAPGDTAGWTVAIQWNEIF